MSLIILEQLELSVLELKKMLYIILFTLSTPDLVKMCMTARSRMI